MRKAFRACSCLIWIWIGITVSSAQVWSAGFANKNQPSLAQGNAFARTTAGAEDISYMFFNPPV